jgi:hypothetical protein
MMRRKMMRRKTEIFIASFLLVFILSFSAALACSAVIKNINYPTSVSAGQPATVTATLELSVSATDRSWKEKYGLVPSCLFLAEAGIIPPGYPLAVKWAVVPGPPTRCCPGNLNFQAQEIKVECEAWEQLGCTKTFDVSLSPNAPASGYCDHCAGQYGNTNPSCQQNPNFFWKGAGWYDGYLLVAKGCYYDLQAAGESQQVYATRMFSIQVTSGGGGSVCGNGNCEYGENFFNCPADCNIWDFFNSNVSWLQQFGITITYLDLILIAAIVSVGSFIIYKIYKGGKKK